MNYIFQNNIQIFNRLQSSIPAWAVHDCDLFGPWYDIVIKPSPKELVVQRLRWIPPGRFWRGSLKGENPKLSREASNCEWFETEYPRHQVIISRGYWLFDTPCTQALWKVVMGNNPSLFQSPARPVENVSWPDVQDFLRKFNEQIPGLNLTLPSEAQWEYAARAGTETAIYTGDLTILGNRNAPALDPIAWYGGNSGVDFDLDNGFDSSSWKEKQYPHTKAGTRLVKLKQANPWGLYDMLGNVWEWCQDPWHADYQGTPTDGSAWEGHDDDENYVLRGGSWGDAARYCRCASREGFERDTRISGLGFRCAQVPRQPEPEQTDIPDVYE